MSIWDREVKMEDIQLLGLTPETSLTVELARCEPGRIQDGIDDLIVDFLKKKLTEQEVMKTVGERLARFYSQEMSRSKPWAAEGELSKKEFAPKIDLRTKKIAQHPCNYEVLGSFTYSNLAAMLRKHKWGLNEGLRKVDRTYNPRSEEDRQLKEVIEQYLFPLVGVGVPIYVHRKTTITGFYRIFIPFRMQREVRTQTFRPSS